MYAIYWTTFMGEFHKVVPENEVKSFIDSLDRLNFPVDRVEFVDG
jgi:hypothetical protein